jgi:hypothetical protein
MDLTNQRWTIIERLFEDKPRRARITDKGYDGDRVRRLQNSPRRRRKDCAVARWVR